MGIGKEIYDENRLQKKDTPADKTTTTEEEIIRNMTPSVVYHTKDAIESRNTANPRSRKRVTVDYCTLAADALTRKRTRPKR